MKSIQVLGDYRIDVSRRPTSAEASNKEVVKGSAGKLEAGTEGFEKVGLLALLHSTYTLARVDPASQILVRGAAYSAPEPPI